VPIVVSAVWGPVHTDQGSQFTAQEFVDAVLDHGVKLSMDGRGAWRDNVFVERLWRSVKYERVYLRAYDSVSAARKDIAEHTGVRHFASDFGDFRCDCAEKSSA